LKTSVLRLRPLVVDDASAATRRNR
jgi:hypothetical protein